MRISIVGAGYVGLVSGACLASHRHEVRVIDFDEERVQHITDGKAPFHEPELDQLLASVTGKHLFATSEFADTVLNSDLTMIAVGTPSDENGNVNLSAIRQVAGQIGSAIRDKSERHTIIVKSTVPPGTTDSVVAPIVEQASGKRRGTDFGLGMNPEFLTEGIAVRDFMYPDRLVFGGCDAKSVAVQHELYAGFPDTPKLATNNSTAEMIKYMSNALLATMISFANEFSDLSTAIGDIDIVEVQEGVHLSRYLSSKQGDNLQTAAIASFVEAGCGFGGSCLPKDVKGLVSTGRQNGVPMPLLEAVLAVNARRIDRVMAELMAGLSEVRGSRIAVLGLSFRPDTSDIRESPAIPLIGRLMDSGAVVSAYDPAAIDEMKHVVPDSDISYCQSMEQCIEGADAIVILTRWDEFKALPNVLDRQGDQPLVVDGRRLLEPSSVQRYAGIGYPGGKT